MKIFADTKWDNFDNELQSLFPNIMLPPVFFIDIHYYLEESGIEGAAFIEIAKFYSAKKSDSISARTLISSARRLQEKGLSTQAEFKKAIEEKASVVHLTRGQTEEEQLLTLYRSLNVGEKQRAFAYMESMLEGRGIVVKKRQPRML